MFGRKKRVISDVETPWGALGWDLHAHLIPQVDDGVRTTEESLDAIRALERLGYAGCVVTPHVYRDLYNNTVFSLRPAFERLSSALRAAGLRFELSLAAEYFGDEHFIAIAKADELLTFRTPANEHNVLIEFPYIGEPLYWADALAAVVRRGYQPIVAHPERYRYVCSDLDGWLDKFRNFGVRYQCDLGSLVGQYGPDVTRAARQLKELGVVSFWGSDLHRPSQVDRFIRPAIRELGKSGTINDLVVSASSP